MWECACDCGAVKIVCGSQLRNGRTKSCGCLREDAMRESTTRHGLSGTSEYRVWCSMRARCNNPKTKYYDFYGGRGIFVCPEWNKSGSAGFLNFLNDMGKRPSSTHSIERVDVNKGYSPDNCVWIEKKDQNKNMSRNIRITLNGETKILSEWCLFFGSKYQMVIDRIRLGWEINETIFKTFPVGCRYSNIKKQKT